MSFQSIPRRTAPESPQSAARISPRLPITLPPQHAPVVAIREVLAGAGTSSGGRFGESRDGRRKCLRGMGLRGALVGSLLCPYYPDSPLEASLRSCLPGIGLWALPSAFLPSGVWSTPHVPASPSIYANGKKRYCSSGRSGGLRAHKGHIPGGNRHGSPYRAGARQPVKSRAIRDCAPAGRDSHACEPCEPNSK